MRAPLDIRKALKEGPFTMRDLAETVGLSYGVVRAWSMGRRNPEPANVERLAAGFRARAAKLEELAIELEAVGKGQA